MKQTRSKRVVTVHEDIIERHRKRQLKKKRARFAVFCSCMALLLVLVACAVAFLTPWFHVSNVTVKGNDRVETADLISASGIKKGESVFSFSMGTVEEALLKVPYIKTVQAKRKLPKSIEITVTESHAVARFEKDALQICIDEDGKVVYAGAQPPENLMTVTGMKVDGYALGEKIQAADADKLETLLEFVSVVESCGCFSKINSIDMTKAENIRFSYGQGITVICGDTFDLSRKILTFMEVARDLPDNAKGEVDLRIKGKAYYKP